MAIRGRRFRVYEALKAAHGEEVATDLMEMVPTVEWADVATKQDLAALEARLGERLERAMRTQLTVILGGVGGMLTAFGLVNGLV